MDSSSNIKDPERGKQPESRKDPAQGTESGPGKGPGRPRPKSRTNRRTGGRRRRAAARAARGVLIGVAALLIAVLVYALFFSAPMILEYGLPAGSKALAKSGFEITAEWARGGPIAGITFGDFEITHTDAEGRRATVFRADTLAVKYDPRRFLRKQWRIESVLLSNPEIVLIRPPEGGVLLPGLKGSRDPKPRKAGPPGGPTIDIQHIELRNATLSISRKDGEERFEEMNLTCSFRREPSGMDIGLGDASFRMPGRNLNVSSTSAKLFYTAGSLEMRDGLVRLLSSVISFSGRMTFRGGTGYDMACEGHPYDVPELAAIFGASWPEGLLEGKATVSGRTDSLAINASVTGIVERFALQDIKVKALRRPPTFSFSRVQGLVNDAEIDATGALRNGSLAFDVRFRGLDASSGFFPDVAFPATDLSGSAGVAHGPGGAPWRVTADMGEGHVSGFQFGSLFFRGRIDPSAVSVDSLNLGRPDMAMVAEGVIGLGAEGEMDLRFSAEVDSVAYAAAWLGAPEIEGSLNAEGSLRGLSSNPILEAWGPVDSVRRGPAAVRGGAFSMKADGLAKGGPISFSLGGGQMALGPQSLGEITVDGVFADNVLEVPGFKLQKGDSSATGSFTLESRDGAVNVSGQELQVGVGDVRWRSEEPFFFSYSSGAYSLQGLRLSSNGGALVMSGRLDRSRESIELNLAATALDMSSLRLLDGRLGGGTASGQLLLRGPLSKPTGTAQLKWNGLTTFGKSTREVILRCELGEEGLDIERLSVDSPVGQVLVAGQVRMDLDLAEIVSGRGPEILREMLETPLDLSVSVGELDLSWLADSADLEGDLAGTLSFSGMVRGSVSDPRLTFDVDASSLSVAGFSVDAFSGDFEYKDGRLGISEARATRGNVSTDLEGYLPLVLDVSKGVDLLGSQPMALDVTVTPGDFGVLADVWKGLAQSSGTFALDATLTGTPSVPALSGSGWLERCSMRLAGMEEEYRDINCRFTLKGDRIEISEISGRHGKKGTFRGSGVVTLAWPGVVDYSFDLTLSQFAVLTPLDFDAVVSGQLEVSAFRLEGGELIPNVRGVARVDEAIFTGRIGGVDDIGPSPAVSGTVTPSWLGEVEIEVPGNAWVRNADAELELAGDMLLIKDFDGMKPRGMLRVIRGKYFLVNTEFEVTSGTIAFEEAVGINPDLDIMAETTVGLGETGDEETIYVHLTGNARDPRIRVSSTSGYSETDIYRMLLAGVLWGQGPAEPGGPDISALATNTLFNAIDARLRFLFGSNPPVKIGLTREETVRGGNGEPETRFSVGRNLSSRLFLQYEQGFSAITRREVNLDYRVSRYLLLRSQIVNNPDRGVTEESSSEINFDLRLRYEF